MSKDLATVFGIIGPQDVDDVTDDNDDASSDVYPSFTITDDLQDNVQGWEQKRTRYLLKTLRLAIIFFFLLLPLSLFPLSPCERSEKGSSKFI